MPEAQRPSRGASSRAVTGFVYWVTSGVAYVLFLLWAFVPAHVLHAYGITYYPSKHWATALPVWCCLAIVFAYVVYESMNMLSVPPLWSLATIQDRFGKVPVSLSDPRSIPPLADLPLPEVCRTLYGRREDG